MMVAVQTEYLGSGRQPKKRKRYLTLLQPDLIALQQLPQARQQLLRQCLKLGISSRWSTWQKLPD